MIGGIGLIACGVIAMLRSSLPGAFGPFSAWNVIGILTEVIYAAAVLVFAIGISRQSSVVARRPLGVTSMAIVALWPFVNTLVAPLLSLDDAPQLPQDEGVIGASMIYFSVALVVQAGAALIAATQIARAGVVPAPWCWAPLWVVGFQAIAWAVPQIVIVSLGSNGTQTWAGVYLLFSTLAGLAGTLGLGILALVLAARQRPESVEVYRSA